MLPSGTRSGSGQRLTGEELAAWRGMLRVSVRLRRELDRRLSERHGITIADYDPAWPARFESERVRIEAALGDLPIRIEHIGSTAVPGLAAKPIVDILVTVDHRLDVLTVELGAFEFRQPSLQIPVLVVEL